MNAIITISNKSNVTISAAVESQRRILESKSDHRRTLRSTAEGGSASVGVTTPKGGVELGGSGHTSATAEDVSTIDRGFSTRLGPKSGFTRIAAGQQVEIAVPDPSATTYFLTLKAGEDMLAEQVSQSTTVHHFVEITGTGKELRYTTTRIAPAINSGDAISLKSGHRYVGPPSESKGWPAGRMSSAAGTHEIIKAKGTGPIQNEDEVRLKGTVLGSDREYCFMYSSDKGWIYYDKHSDNEKQRWTISRVGNGKGPIRAGDAVILYNSYWRSAQLRPKGDWLECDSAPKGGNDMAFVIDQI